jgi:TolB-like protein/DNA-binding SARP family transcriptional activator/cytochrome c-type biogenesis protein CcmH/NrfG
MLGGFELTSADGLDLTPPRRKSRALVALLALAPATGWPRDQLSSFLWADRGGEHARGSLRQALVELRHILGDSILLTDRETAAFNPAAVHTDAVEFARLAAAGEFERAALLYRGELLDGVSLPDAGFDDWLLIERTRLHDLAVDVLDQLLKTQSGEAAMATAHRLLELDPTHEKTHRALMRLHAGQGNRSQALRQFQICRDSLARGLGVKPETETERLWKEIQSPTKSAPAKLRPSPSTVVAGALTIGGERDKIIGSEPPYRLSRGSGTGLPTLSIAKLAAAAVVVLALVASAGWWLSQEKPSTGKPVVAVLPFDDFAGDEASRRLARGLSEDIITDLARFPEFRVIARNSTETYKGKPQNPIEIGAALHAGFVVEGSIQRQANRVRITAQLIDTKTGNHLWSDRWDRPDQDLFAIQTEISEQIANRFGGGAGLIQEAGRIAAHRKAPSNLTAYELYLLGTEKLEQITRADVKEAIRLLDRAVELDPGLARAWVELYHSHFITASFGIDPENNRKLAVNAAERAVSLDPSDAEAHAVYAMSLGDGNDTERAKAEFDTALRLAPNQFEILTFYAFWASTFGEPQRGAQMVDQAIRLNPSYPMWSTRIFAHAYFMVGRYADALRMIERLTPENYDPRMWAYRCGALAALGNAEEAQLSVKEALKRFPDLTIEGLVNSRRYDDAESGRLIETMRLAGFPPCATPEVLAKFDRPVRLPECYSQL